MANDRIQGKVLRTLCPICHGLEIERLWQIPFSKVEPAVRVNNASTSMLPILDTKSPIYAYDECASCESVFLNPYPDVKASYAGSEHHAKRFNARVDWASYEGQYQAWMQAHMRPEDKTFLDAGCGGGQYLFIAADSGRWSKMIGLELSAPAVQNILAQGRSGIEAYVCDLDTANAQTNVPAESVDFAILSEVFEHVSTPWNVLSNITKTLRPGGRFFITSQATEGKLPVRPEEPIYASRKGFTDLMGQFFSKTINFQEAGGKWKAVFEK